MTNDGKRKLTHKDYTVAWVVVLQVELTPARKLLDKEDEPLPRSKKDDNNYVLGQSGEHNIVITRPSVYGTNATAHAVANMLRTFPNVRFGLLVGIGGGAPKPPRKDPNKDIRLGDVVVSFPKGGHGGVLQYDMGRWEGECDFQIQSHLNRPPGILLSAITGLGSEHDLDNGRMNEYIRNGWWKSVTFPGRDEDRLFRSDYRHIPGEDCEACDRTMTITRVERQSNEPVVHQGLIASGNALEKSPQHRDKLRDRWDVACFEMEAAGLMNDFPCLVIRGISDYSDSHKNDEWQPYAALTAAAYAKDLLRVIKGEQVIAEPPATERLNRPKQDTRPGVGLET
ncbi:purine and uridine phosphorylase [Aspergillus pseudocaelatus]|uniref:Purine and uridine phosphorylase n=1 Tax=Aspergillus pseudocaelatus TaxID=1825620 RepID=A0ABQ6X2J9_9EURO|nr:purine and uridine phosphorylase [Aspergillus pseudocaelatus]